MTTDFRRFHVSLRLRPQQADDQRHYQRFSGEGLGVRLDGRHYAVRDVSIGGICIEGTDAAPGTEVALDLFLLDDAARSHPVRGMVAGHSGEGTHIRFASMTYSLAKFLVHHAARCVGVEPYALK
ncbi:MAG: hypothetical protein NVV74_24750 [Magnetospirillum sp.]|nr:hypothetical protein [Magnetospirillum sp.]